MTDRLYYTDAYRSEFTAVVLAVDPATRQVQLDRTAFYPTSGGQPHDVGMLGALRVTDVIDEDGRVVHVLESIDGLASGAAVDGTVDWVRRFDWMQQHTGQHLLSALCADAYGWPTTSVHFGDAYCTVDIAAPNVDTATLREIERAANAVITSNRAVTVTFEDSATARGLRKPSERTGELRVISIDGIDRSACGGTHVRHTGEIGSILLRRAERTKGAVRIEFLCGARAVSRASADAELLSRAARALSAAPDELPALVESQLQRLTESERERKRLASELARHEAAIMWSGAALDDRGMRRIVLDTGDAPVKDAEPLAMALVALGGCQVLVRASTGVMLAASPDCGIDAGAALKAALGEVGGRGGGSPRAAQGSVPDAGAAGRVGALLGFA
ncbi:MAG TPA: alanyl-tRNA editing protein [Gemmatimonas sp.]|nr:alanyl-tRNA editing protein [Gemmatimonas sp.]